MKKLLEKILNDSEKDDLEGFFEKDQNKYNCEIHIKKNGTNLEAKLEGNLIGLLVALKTTLDDLQNQNKISDAELEILMLSAVNVKKEREHE